MPWNLLLLPLLGGFLFLRNCHYTRIKFQRFESYRLLFESAVWAFGFVAISRPAAFALHFVPLPPSVWATIGELAPFPFFGTTCLAFLLGPIAAWLVNQFVDPLAAKELAVEQTGDQLLALLNDAMDRNAAVLLTLASRKVYVGYVSESPNLETKLNYLALLPAMSGYRDEKNFAVRFTTDYISLWQSGQVAAAEFLIVLPVESIKSASIFDLAIYETHFAAASEATAPIPTSQAAQPEQEPDDPTVPCN